MIKCGPAISEEQARRWNPAAIITTNYEQPVYLSVIDYFPFTHPVAATGALGVWQIKSHQTHAQLLEQIRAVCWKRSCVFFFF